MQPGTQEGLLQYVFSVNGIRDTAPYQSYNSFAVSEHERREGCRVAIETGLHQEIVTTADQPAHLPSHIQRRVSE